MIDNKSKEKRKVFISIIEKIEHINKNAYFVLAFFDLDAINVT